MGFFKDLKEDLSQAVNELIPEDELLGQEEYIDNLDEDLIGLDAIKKENLSSAPMKEKGNLLEPDMDLQLEDDSFVNTLDNELASTLEEDNIGEPILSDREEETLEMELPPEEEVSYEIDDNQMDDLSDLVKEFENQMMTDESNLSLNDEIENDVKLDVSDSDLQPVSDYMELNLMEQENDFSMEEEISAFEEELPEEETSLPLDLNESLLEEENLTLEDNQNIENLSLENSPTEEDKQDNEEIEPSTIEEIGLMDTMEHDIDAEEQLSEDSFDEGLSQEIIQENRNTDTMSDIFEDSNTMDYAASFAEESKEKLEGEGGLEQQMEEETMTGLDEVLEATDNLENDNVDMDLIAQMLGEEEETPLVVPDEMPNLEEPIIDGEEEDITPSEVFVAETEQIEEEIKEPSAEAANDVTVITKGTRIEGNIISDSSLEVMGTVKGDIECLGKLSVTGHVEGNSSAAEIFVNTTRLLGNLESKGAVKLGAGTVVLGDIAATSAVIAGAVKGEIDVDGPIIVDSTAIVKGNIKAKSVQVNNGAVIDGYCSLAYAALDIDNFFDGENAE